MNAIKITAVLVILSILGGGYYLYQKDKQKKALIAHNIQKFKRETEAAQKSSPAGLLLMASTIKRYHQIKGQYPEKLIQLYPELIPDRAFIEKVAWQYKLGKNTFILTKSLKGKSSITSIGPDLKLVAEHTDLIAKNAPSLPAGKSQNLTVVLKNTPLPSNSRKLLSENEKHFSEKSQQIVNIVPSKKNITPPNKNKESLPEYIIVKEELTTDEYYLKKFNKNYFYIWKTTNGSIGFSNIQYPDEKNIKIFNDNTWIQYQVPKVN